MKKIVLLLVLFNYSVYGFCQTDNKLQAVTNFISSYGARIIGTYAHPSCGVENANVTSNGADGFAITINYIDKGNNSPFSCTYQLNFNNGYVSGFESQSCGSNDISCFSFWNGLLMAGNIAYKIYNQTHPNQNNQENSKSLMQEIQDIVVNQLAKKIEDLRAWDYCYGNLYLVWSQNNYADSYNAPPITFNPHPNTQPNSSTQGSQSIFEDKKQLVEDFIAVQDERDFDKMMTFFSPSIHRSWDLYNPTIEQLQNRTYHLWEVTSSSKQTVQNIEQIDDNTIKADVLNVYYVRKTNVQKQIEYDIYYVFDSNNKIVETYGYEK